MFVTGVVYVAVGEEFIAEACQSAESLKRHDPALPVTPFSSAPVASPHFERVVVPEPPYHPKVARITSLAKSPYERTLSIDTDAYICGPVSDIFDVMGAYDLAIMPAPRRLREGDLEALGTYMRKV